MTISSCGLRRFATFDELKRATLDLAIERADLVRLVAVRRHQLTAMRLKRDDDVTDAQLRLAMAQAALEGFDREPGRAPA